MARRAGLRAATGARARIAVIGAGVTGASFVDSCVARLGAVQSAAAAADVHVFEMGRGPGGRCSTRNGARHGTPAFSVGKGDGGDRGDFAEAVRARIAELDAKIDALAIDVARQQTLARIDYLLTRAGAPSGAGSS